MPDLIEVAGLLAWFKSEGRQYPWTIKPTPYKVWISEVMLQQTVVSTVIPYYRKWMVRFPSITKLAAADEAELLHSWEGLGYYSRVRHIHKAAHLILSRHKGKIPCDYAALCRLPGIGAYTAGAIMSIAYNKPYTVLDANVLRIMQRLLALPAAGLKEKARISTLLESIIPVQAPALFNQALMQLGQLVCRKTLPLCTACPLAKHCAAFEKQLQDSIPVRKKQETVLLESEVSVFCYRKQCYVVLQEQGRFRGLWLFPRREKTQPPPAVNTLPGKAEKCRPLKEHNHFYTHYKEHLIPTLYLFKVKPQLPPAGQDAAQGNNGLPAGKWVAVNELSTLPFPSVYRKIVKEVQEILLPRAF